MGSPEGTDGGDGPVHELRRRVEDLETKLAKSEAALILAQSVDVMFEGLQVVGRDWRYLYVNETAARHGRTSPASLLGRTMMEAYPGIELTPLFVTLRECMAHRVCRKLENEFKYPDDSQGWFELQVEAVPEGLLILSSEITERKQAQLALLRSREDLATTLSCLADGVITVDVAGRVLTMNPAAEKLVGTSFEMASGKNLRDMLHLLDANTDEVLDLVSPSNERRVLSQSAVVHGIEGSRIPVLASRASLSDFSGKVRGSVIALHDVTREHALQMQLQHSQKLEALGRLAGGIAHDFNNALSVILTLSHLLEEEVAHTSSARRDVRQIGLSAEHAAGLTKQLLAFSRQQVMKPELLDLNTLLTSMVALFARVLPSNIQTEGRQSPNLRRVRVDRGQMEQVIMNLALNAVDAMPDGGRLTLTTSNADLDDAYAADHVGVAPGHYVLLSICDSGQGMDPQTQAKIFEPFFTTKATGKGTGLGLATVYGIVKQSGGNVWLYSELGKGTTFKIYLPGDIDEQTESPAPIPLARRGNETILLVEDDDLVRAAATRILTMSGYKVLPAPDGHTAHALFAAHSDVIDLLLCDVFLQGDEAKGVVRELVAKRPQMRVVFMSGYSADTLVHQRRIDPNVRYIEKPFTPRTLSAQIRDALDS
jgi:PAS domain S-box-containing protein